MDSSDDRLVSPSDLTYHEISHRFTRLPTLTRPALNLFCAQCLTRLLQSPFCTGLMSFLTVYILFADDLRVAAFSVAADDYFYGLAVGCLGLFVVETGLSFYSRPAYRFSFYFYLDCISAVSLVADVGWIWERVMTFSSHSSEHRRVREAGKVSRAGTQAPRVIRIVRLIRLIRLTKLYKHAKLATQATDGAVQDVALPKESRLGQKLVQLTTKRLIVLVLSLIVLFPLFDLDFYQDLPSSWGYGLGVLEQTKGSWGFERALGLFIEYQEMEGRPLVLVMWNAQELQLVWQSKTPLSALRYSEVLYSASNHFISIVDIRSDTQLSAFLSLFQTILIAFVLLGGATVLSRDATTLVIVPIEKMMLKVQRLASNPMSILEQKSQDVYDFLELQDTNLLETGLIEQTILKIGALLALSFGAAGAEMITASMTHSHLPNTLTAGRKVKAIFAFCDIRNFTDVTEVLGEGVMVFVNEIASILHHTVDQHLGFPNANVGDAFLLVWKPKPSDSLEAGLEETEKLSVLADLTLVCILKVIFQLQVDSRFVKYRKNPAILKRLPNYTVTLGFALHIGWAIEGPIGTSMKTDASYLSPHINLTMRLQESTKLYGVPLLISGPLYSLFTPETQFLCRHIDTVAFQSSLFVLKVFTLDVEVSHVLNRPRDACYSLQRSRVKRKKVEWAVRKRTFRAGDLFRSSRKLIKLRKEQDGVFDATWKRLIEEYEDGNWGFSRADLSEVLRLRPWYGPAKVLQGVMAAQDYRAPGDWKGYRQLSAI